jgi:hypothetical protein
MSLKVKILDSKMAINNSTVGIQLTAKKYSSGRLHIGLTLKTEK